MNAAHSPLPPVTTRADWWRPPARVADAGITEAPSDRRGRVAFVAVVIYSLVLIGAPQEFFPVLQPLRPALLIGAVAIALHLRDRWSGAIAVPAAREVPLALLLVAWAAVTIPFSYWPGGSVDLMVDLYSKSIAVFLLLAGTLTSLGRVRIVCWAIALLSAVIGTTAVLNYASGTMLPGAADRIMGYGASGLAGNPNDLALLLNLFIPILVALVITARRLSGRLCAMAALGCAVAGTVASFSRAGFLTLMVVGLLHLWSLARRGALVAATGVVGMAVLVVMLAPPTYMERLATIGDIGSDRTGSAQDRWSDTVAAASFVARHPVIGAGAGMDVLVLNEARGPRWLSVHNVYLQHAVDLGLVGLALFVLLWWAAVRGVLRTEHASVDGSETAALARAVRISLLAFAVAGFFHPVAYHAFFYYIAGLAVALQRIGSRARRPAVAAAQRT